jgi:hypothetical protein
VAVDGAGNVYTTGSFEGSVNFDPGPGTYILDSAYNAQTIGKVVYHLSTYDIFLSKLDTNGNFVAAADIVSGASPNAINNNAHAIALDSSGNIYSTGGFRGTANFNPTGTYDLTVDGGSNSPDQDIFVSQLTQPPSAGGAAAPSSPHTGGKSAVLLASSPISLHHFGESINLLLSAPRGVTPQEPVSFPLTLDESESAASRQPLRADREYAIRSPLAWSAGTRPAAELLDRVFADIGTELHSRGQALS